MEQKSYIAIDLKSFYASVECVERGLDPLDINLVVADESRTDKTICLAATPAIKSFGVSGRSRLFEVKQRIAQVNNERRRKAPGRNLNGASSSLSELNRRPELAVDFMIAPPRMAYYMKYSTQIYSIYLKYVAPEDSADGRSMRFYIFAHGIKNGLMVDVRNPLLFIWHTA